MATGAGAMLTGLAYYYGIPVIDVGLRMAPAAAGCGHGINGRVTTKKSL